MQTCIEHALYALLIILQRATYHKKSIQYNTLLYLGRFDGRVISLPNGQPYFMLIIVPRDIQYIAPLIYLYRPIKVTEQ